jgi:imidazoleglycerol phosphate dehydratase HisB
LDSLVEALANAADATLSLRTTIGGEPQRAGVEYSTRAHDSALFSCAGAAIGAACAEAFHELGQAEVVVVRGGAVVKATLEDASGAVVCDTAPYGRVPRGGRLRVGSYRTCLTPLFFEALGLHLGWGLRLTSQRTGDAMNCLEAAFAACGRLLRVARPGESVPCGPRTGTASARTASCFVDLDEADEASEVATGVEAVDTLVTTLADVAGWRLTVEAADTDGDGRSLAADVGSAVGLAVANAISSSIAGDGAGVSGKVTACVARGEGLFTWDVRVSDEYVDETCTFAAEHVERLIGSFSRAASFAGLRLHVSAAGVLPAADAARDAAVAVGLALREALQPVAS